MIMKETVKMPRRSDGLGENERYARAHWATFTLAEAHSGESPGGDKKLISL